MLGLTASKAESSCAGATAAKSCSLELVSMRNQTALGQGGWPVRLSVTVPEHDRCHTSGPSVIRSNSKLAIIFNNLALLGHSGKLFLRYTNSQKREKFFSHLRQEKEISWSIAALSSDNTLKTGLRFCCATGQLLFRCDIGKQLTRAREEIYPFRAKERPQSKQAHSAKTGHSSVKQGPLHACNQCQGHRTPNIVGEMRSRKTQPRSRAQRGPSGCVIGCAALGK